MDLYFIKIDNNTTNNYHHKISRLYLKKILSKFYQIESEILDDNGKPYLRNNKIYFSISHSKNLLVIAFDRNAVGIDIEYEKPRDFKKILKYFKIDTEDDITDEEFFKIWTVYEAEFKSKIGGELICFKYNNYIGAISSQKINEVNFYELKEDFSKIKTKPDKILTNPNIFLGYNYLSMLIKYFERYFKKEILERGKLLFEIEDVNYLYKHNNTLYFYVKGTKEYTVEITIDKDYKILNTKCDCPYAKKDLCKHIAACLYYIRFKLEQKHYF